MRNTITGLLLGLILAVSLGADARTGDHAAGSWTDWQELGALDLCDGAAINVAVNCGNVYGIKTEGYNAITFEIAYTQSAGSGWQFYLQSCYEGHTTTDCTDATDWHTVAIERVVGGTGVSFHRNLYFHDTTVSDQITWTIPINYKRLRLGSFVAKGSPGVGDEITVNARVSWLPAF